mmetsp:Transcript_11292/g.28031  ORF Transcript_11292/g.28031 Transcript_11292/m.28031 type:complete len:509 (+) Transcript_11292:199-1725(+)
MSANSDVVKRSKAAQRKQKQRESEEENKLELQKLIGFHVRSAERPPCGSRHRLYRPRKTIVADELLEAAIEKVKKCLLNERNGNGVANGAKEDAQYSKWTSVRSGMLQSKSLGTMLLRKKDMVVVESSAAMELFCPWEVFKGYVGQSLLMMIHTEDLDRFLAAVSNCSPESVGKKVSVRLLRWGFDASASGVKNKKGSHSSRSRTSKTEASHPHAMEPCLLAQYVEKELTISHVSQDGASLLLLCPMLHPTDITPLATSSVPCFWDLWKRETETYARTELKLVSQCDMMALMRWTTDHLGLGELHRDASRRSKKAQGVDWVIMRIIREGFGFEDAVADLIASYSPHAVWVDTAGCGRPRVQIACKLSHDGFETPWSKYAKLIPNGSMDGMGTFHASAGNYSAVILPEAGRPFEAKLGNVLCKLDGNTQRFSIAGFVCWIFKSPMISQGHFQGDGTRVFKQHFFGTSPDTVDPDPDLRRFMDEDHEDKGYFFMPFSTDDLSSQQWQGMR